MLGSHHGIVGSVGWQGAEGSPHPSPPGWGPAHSCPAVQQWPQRLGRAVAAGRPSVCRTAGAALASAGHSRSQGPHVLGLLTGLPWRVPVTDWEISDVQKWLGLPRVIFSFKKKEKQSFRQVTGPRGSCPSVMPWVYSSDLSVCGAETPGISLSWGGVAVFNFSSPVVLHTGRHMVKAKWKRVESVILRREIPNCGMTQFYLMNVFLGFFAPNNYSKRTVLTLGHTALHRWTRLALTLPCDKKHWRWKEMNDKGNEEETEPWTHGGAGVFHSQHLESQIIIIQIRSRFDFLTIYHLHALRKGNWFSCVINETGQIHQPLCSYR